MSCLGWPQGEAPRARRTTAQSVIDALTRAPRKPLSELEASMVIQRSFRGMKARQQLRNRRSRHAITGFAAQIAADVGSLVGRVVDNVLLAPVNLATENLIHAALGRMLSVLVVGYDKRNTIRMTSGGIVIGGSRGLHIDDEALAALQGGMSMYTDVWLASLTIRLPLVLGVWPVEVSVPRVAFTMPPVALVLSPQRTAELDRAMNGDKPKPPKKQGSSLVGDLDARVAGAKFGSGATLPAGQRGAGGRTEGGEGGGGYGQMDRVVDGLVISIGQLELAMPQWGAEPAPDPSGAADAPAAPAARRAGLADVRTLSVGCLVCGVRGPSRNGRGPLSRLVRAIRRHRGDPARELAPPPASTVFVRFDGLRYVNCNSDFAPASRLLAYTVHPSGMGGLGGLLGALGSQFGSLGGRRAAAARQASSASLSRQGSADGLGGAEVRIHKKLSTSAVSMSQTNAHGMRLPLLQATELAIDMQLVRSARSGRIVRQELEVVFAERPAGWLAEAVPYGQRTHGLLRFRTAPSPASGGRGGAGGALALLSGLVGGSAGGHEAGVASRLAMAEELAMWRRSAEHALSIAASFDALDSHVRACLQRPLSQQTLRELGRARAKRGFGRARGETAGELLWGCAEHEARLELPLPQFRALLARHEVLLSDDTFRMLVGKLGGHLSESVDLHTFLATYMPDRAADADAAARAAAPP